jgi:hypothetical protein
MFGLDLNPTGVANSLNYTGLINVPGQGPGYTNLAVPDTRSREVVDLDRNTNREQVIPQQIKQTERLLTTRSRAIQHEIDRGQTSYIKVLSSSPGTSLSRHTKSSDGNTKGLGKSLEQPLKDAIVGSGYNSFLLTSIQGSLDEKVQITEVFGDAEVTYFFGRQPLQLQFSGVLIDSVDNDWFTQWLGMYSEVLRGTQLAKNYELIQIVTPNMTMTGTIIRSSWSQSSERDVDIPFQFTFLAKKISPLPIVARIDTSIGKSIANAAIPSYVNQSQINSIKTGLGLLNDTIKNPLSTLTDYTNAFKMPLTGMTDLDSPFYLKTPSMKDGTLGVAKTPTITDMFANVSSNLAGIRSSLFSPVYGVLSSLTKLIQGTTGGLSSVLHSFTDPVRTILRDIRNISNQAIGVVNLINSSVNGVTSTIRNVDTDLRSTLALLKKTSGVITTAPMTITGSLRNLINTGTLPTTRKYLQNRSGTSFTLSNGSLSSTSGVSLTSNGGYVKSKLNLLNSGPKHTPKRGASL